MICKPLLVSQVQRFCAGMGHEKERLKVNVLHETKAKWLSVHVSFKRLLFFVLSSKINWGETSDSGNGGSPL